MRWTKAVIYYLLQGLNRLGAIALLFLNEEDAFWCLVYIIEILMPADFYTRNLLGSQVDQVGNLLFFDG